MRERKGEKKEQKREIKLGDRHRREQKEIKKTKSRFSLNIATCVEVHGGRDKVATDYWCGCDARDGVDGAARAYCSVDAALRLLRLPLEGTLWQGGKE